MTRLTSLDVIDIEAGWPLYEKRLERVTGFNLLEVAALAYGCGDFELARKKFAGRRLAAVSVSSGEGVVTGFAESLASIGRHLGMEARAMARPDEEGFDEARRWEAEFIIYADDDSFMARDMINSRLADNNRATSLIFTKILQLMNGRKSAGVVVLGLGVIGLGAAGCLKNWGVEPFLFDVDPARRQRGGRETGCQVVENYEELARILKRTHLIFEATPIKEALDRDLWPWRPVVAAPGVPLAWPEEWMGESQEGRLWHDPLQAGTASMLADLILRDI